MSTGRRFTRHRTDRFVSGLIESLLVALAFGFALTVAPARAGEALPDRVGRIANVQGTLYHAPDESASEWSEIGLNEPVAQGDNLWVDHDGRAEVDYGGGQFRLAGDTNLHVSRLDERALALFIASGRVIVRVRFLDAEDSVRVDTPTTQVALMRPGLYRVDVEADAGASRTTLLVREGEAEVAVASGSQAVLPGQAAVVTGTQNITADIRNGGDVDEFDTWSAARDRVYERPRETAYVSRQMVGQADLDTYGAWQMYPDYGAVWFPTVDPEWAPYRYGHWTWLPGWGYAWVDSAPWGYAPFHYGRWAYISGHWGWCPGAFVMRPVWAPALVAWYGGSGWSQRVAHGGAVYGWVPLGWREPLVPWWRGCTSRCYARYNRPYAVNVAERPDARPAHFANWTVPGGVTAVPAGALAGGRPVPVNRVPVGNDIAFAPAWMTTPLAVKPAPVRPGAVRPGRGTPPPASTYPHTPAAALPAAIAARRGSGAASHFAIPPTGADTPAPIRIDDGRHVLAPPNVRTGVLNDTHAGATISRAIPQPGERPVAPAPMAARPGVAPAPSVERPIRAAPPPSAISDRSFRAVPMPPAPSAPLPRVAPPPMPAAPIPPRIVQVPVPAANVPAAPAPLPAQRGPVRVDPAAPVPVPAAR